MNQQLLLNKQPPGDALQLQLLLEREEIFKGIETVTQDLEKEYGDQEITIVTMIQETFIFVADLIRHLHLPICLEMIQTAKEGVAHQLKGIEEANIKGKRILIVDTLFDTGETLAEMVSDIQKMEPISVQSLVLISKDVPRHTDYRPDRVLFEIEDRFIVGYGLDYKEYYRELPDIYAIER